MRSVRAVLEGMTEWVWDSQREMDGWELGSDLLLDDEDDELDDDIGLLIHLQKGGMALPLENKAQNGEALSFVVLFTEKEIQEEDLA